MSEDNIIYIRDRDWRPEVYGSMFWRKVDNIRAIIENISRNHFPPRLDDVIEWKRAIRKRCQKERDNEERLRKNLIWEVKHSQRVDRTGRIRSMVHSRPAYYLSVCELIDEEIPRPKEGANG